MVVVKIHSWRSRKIPCNFQSLSKRKHINREKKGSCVVNRSMTENGSNMLEYMALGKFTIFSVFVKYSQCLQLSFPNLLRGSDQKVTTLPLIYWLILLVICQFKLRHFKNMLQMGAFQCHPNENKCILCMTLTLY